MEIGTLIQNFRVTKVRTLSELEARLWEMEHEKTGAQLCWLDRADENKTFGIAFKTIPEDSTGVFHILEHSVLCGSDKYPVKEPFVELLKSSVQTFLNAMTYPDKTVYPVSSRNDQDFLNLLDVYMDAVLHPAIYHKPEIFRQEGWRYELREEGAVYQGVVFNEMKGAYAGADTELSYAMNQLMFPDNCYRWESGGHPEFITDLTYEQFMANHRKYYHPSNARIMLVGSVDLDAALSHIDAYLKDYDRQEANFPIPMQQPRPFEVLRRSYEIGENEDPKNRTIVSCGHMLGDFSQQEKLYAAQILQDYLAGDNDGPVKQAILSRGLGQDVKIQINEGIQQNWASWEVWNTGEEHIPAIRQVLADTFTDLARNGLDRDRLEACCNRFAFRLRDRDGGWAPRSLAEALTMLDSWLYDGDPAQYLLVEDVLNSLTAKLDTDYYQNLIREIFLDNPHTAMAVLVPSTTLGAEKREKEAARVKAASDGWTDGDRAHYEALGRELARWQQSQDTPEALATIPMLQLSDLTGKTAGLPFTLQDADGTPLLVHDVRSSLHYVNLHFDASDLTREELPLAALLCRLLGKLPTGAHTSAKLQMLVKQKIGSLRFSPNVYDGADAASFRLNLTACSVALSDSARDAAALVAEILTATRFDDEAMLKNLLDQTMMRLQMEFVGAGNRYAMTRAAAPLSAAGTVQELTAGSSFIAWVKAQCAAESLSGLCAGLEQVSRKIFCRSRLTLSISDNAQTTVPALLEAFPAGVPALPAVIVPDDVIQVGLPIPAAIGFASKAANLKALGQEFDGSWYVLANVLDFCYLWNEIRVQGGAYGCGFSCRSQENLQFHTYRDPQPGRSLGIFDRAGDFIRSFCTENTDLTPMILGAYAGADPLMNTQRGITLAETRHFKGTTQADAEKLLQQLLDTTPEKLIALADTLDALAKTESVCVVAGQALLEGCGDRLGCIRQIL